MSRIRWGWTLPPLLAAIFACYTLHYLAVLGFLPTLLAEEHGVVLTLKVDQRRNADPADRRLWFVTDDDSVERIIRFNEGAIQSLPGPNEIQEQFVAVQAEEVADVSFASLGLGGRRVAVELNREIVAREEYPATRLSAGDVVEVVQFVGGG